MFGYLHKTTHRTILEKLIKEYSVCIKGEILDAGSKNRRYDSLFSGNITAVDLIPDDEHGVIAGDITKLDFETASFDSVLAVEVLEYIPADRFRLAIDEMLRVLKKGGHCVFSIPFMYREHNDRTRISAGHIKEIVKGYDIESISVTKIGNAYTVLTDICRIKLLSSRSVILRKMALPAVVHILRSAAVLFSLDAGEDDFYSGIFVVIKK